MSIFRKPEYLMELVFPQWPTFVATNHTWVKEPFKVHMKPMDCNVTE